MIPRTPVIAQALFIALALSGFCVIQSTVSAAERTDVTVSGTVFSDGRPVPGEAVFLCLPGNIGLSGPEVRPVGKTGGDGTFSFNMPDEHMKQPFPIIFVLKKGRGLGAAYVTGRTQAAAMRFDLTEPMPVTGIIRNESGEAIAGAAVTPLVQIGEDVFDKLYVHIPGTETMTGADGSFTLSCLPAGMSIHVRIAADGYGGVNRGPVRAGQRDFPFTLVPEGKISGRVIDSMTGKPAAGATVHARPIQTGPIVLEPYSATSSADGGFLLTGILPGMYTMSVPDIPPSFQGRVALKVENIDVRSRETTAIPDIPLIQGVVLKGRVTFRETGEPLPGVQMRVFSDRQLQTAYTDTDGAYTIVCTPGKGGIHPYTMNVYDDTGMEPRTRDLDTAEGDSIAGLDFSFEKDIQDIRIRTVVRALDPGGEPVPYAELNGFPVMGETGETVIWRSTKRTRLGFRASREDLHLHGQATVTIAAGDTLPVFDIPMTRYETSSAYGRAVDQAGKPVPCARVTIRTRRNDGMSSWAMLLRALTDGNGAFQVDSLVVGNENVIAVENEGYQIGIAALGELTNTPRDIGDIVLAPAAGWLEGIVMDKGGNSIPGATVITSKNTFSEGADRTRLQTVTDSKGRYRLDGLMPKMDYMQVSHQKYQGYYSREIVLNRKRNIILLSPDRYLEGKVIDDEGQPLPDVAVSTGYMDQFTQYTTSGADGHFRLDGLLHVTQYITVTKPGWGQFIYQFIPTNGSREFILSEPRDFIAGTVVDALGIPVSGAFVRVLSVDYPQGADGCYLWALNDDEISRKTDGNGAFRFDRIMGPQITIEVETPGTRGIEFSGLATNRDDHRLVANQVDQATERTAPDFIPNQAIESNTAPPLTVAEWLGGGPQDLAALKGKIVILDFWSIHDPESVQATGCMDALQREYGPRGLVVIGIHEHTGDTAALADFVRERNLQYSIVIDEKPKNPSRRGLTFDTYGAGGFGTDMVIDREGSVWFSTNVHQVEQKVLDLIAN